MRRFFVIIEVDPDNIVHPGNRPNLNPDDLAAWVDAAIEHPFIRATKGYGSLKDLMRDHVLDALAGTRDKENSNG